MRAWRQLQVGQTVWWARPDGTIGEAVVQELPEPLRDSTRSRATTEKGGPPMAYVAIGDVWDLVACANLFASPDDAYLALAQQALDQADVRL